MIDRHYFEQVLPDQLKIMERPARLMLHTSTGAEYMVHSLVAGHEAYVILNVYGDGKPPQHSKPWQRANPGQDPEVFDQVCIPYSWIALTHLTARATKGDDERRVVGFQQT
jgi:hypothetical protein